MKHVISQKQNKANIQRYFDSVADEKQKWRRKGWYYYRNLERYLRFLIPEGSSVLELGSETGDILAALKPGRGLGIGFSQKMVEIARRNFPGLEFKAGDIETLDTSEKFDYVLVASVIGYVYDIQDALAKLKEVCRADTRIIIIYYNYLWEPLVKLAQKLRFRMKRPDFHWIALEDMENFLYLEGFEVIKKKHYFLLPLYIPLICAFLNKVVANLPFFKKMCFLQVLVARANMTRKEPGELTCSVIVPCRNEEGNIEETARRIPKMGKATEIIFVENLSRDKTLTQCHRVKEKYPDKSIKVISLSEKGVVKIDAVHAGFSQATGDILMVLDADLTAPPEDLSRFFEAIASGKGELVNGSRLVYKMEKGAMRFLNVLGNKFFSSAFTFLLEQYIKDTLCGTKVLWRTDYEKIARHRDYFGDFDPFCDFELLFGASRMNLKIIEIPVHYYERTYGSSQIKRFRHGWLLLKMAFLAMGRIKFV